MTAKSLKIAIIGGGPAGFFSAIHAAESCPSAQVDLIEGTQRPLTKVLISGGGRCNVTHHCFEPKQLVQFYPRGSRELIGPFHSFQPRDTEAWFARHGVTLKVESDGRMFPVTDSSRTIADCLRDAASKAGVHLKLGKIVRHIARDAAGSFFLTFKADDVATYDRVLLATGSSPAGHQLAASLGHRIVDPVPSLFTFEISHPLLQDMAGQSFLDVRADLAWNGVRSSYSQRGPLLITHWGLSGPAVLKLSAFAARELHDHHYQGQLTVSFFPDDNAESLAQKLVAVKNSQPKKQLGSVPPEGISRKFWEQILAVMGWESSRIWHDLSQKEARQLAEYLTAVPFLVSGKGVFKEEFVTCGGIALIEVDFKTMQSRLVPGLYFAGEILDIDGVTGGFNFQNTWTTGWIAGRHIGIDS